MSSRMFMRVTVAMLSTLCAVRVAASALAPIIEDEAYYATWSRALDWGYFDHPPMVAWIGVTSKLADGSPLAARAGCVMISALFVPLAAGLLRRAGVTDRAAFVGGLVAACFGLYAIGAGVLLTPDVVLMVAWCAALHEAASALSDRRARWVTAGVATGIGLLSKYIMALIGPVFLVALLVSDRGALRTRWPWLGALAAMMVFSPHVLWNAQHEWESMRLQLSRGFAESHEVDVAYASPLPRADAPVKGSKEWAIGAYFSGMERAKIDNQMERLDDRLERARQREARGGVNGSGAAHSAPAVGAAWSPRAAAGRLAEFAGGQLALWGAMLPLPVAACVLLALRRYPGERASLNPKVKPLLVASVIVPLAFFGLVSLVARVEANWPAVYMAGAAVLMSAAAARRWRVVCACAAGNVIIIIAAAAYAANPPASGRSNRILEETHGWADLAELVASIEGPVLADAHQTIAQIRFHQPGAEIAQWPGFTRPSEFVRRAAWNPFTVEKLRERGGFYLLIGKPQPPRLAGFRATGGEAICDCVGRSLDRVEAMRHEVFTHPCPDRSVHTWYLVRYEPE